ncbi:MAG: DUF4868 domain-containing protein [Oscillospiraceae bacterium]|jgi:hypothetical protein|nr:DUF4868 domain-containing protein [Oscillospiraceae bacterium]
MKWKFAIYTAHKSRDGVELEWNQCKMAGIEVWIVTVRDMLLRKPVAEKPVAPYSPFLSDRENIATLASSDDMIRQQLAQMCSDIRSADARAPADFVSGAAPRPTGHAFFAEDGDGGAVILMRRVNPFVSGSSRICLAEADEVRFSDKPVLKLTPAVDFLMLDGACYFFSSGVEKDFDFENRHFAIAAKRLEMVAAADVISNIEALEKAAFTPRNARKFVDFDKQVLKYIVGLPLLEREEFLTTYGVTINNEGRMDTSDGEQCELIIDLLCSRSCLDPLGRLAVGSNITVRE